MRVLWLKTELLHPVDKGGKIRSYNMLRELKQYHHITYLTLDDGRAAPDAGEAAREYCHEVVRIPHNTARKSSPRFFAELAGNLFSTLPYAIAKYRSRNMGAAIECHLAQGTFDLLVCDFLAPSVNIPDGELPLPSVLFQHNVEAVIWRRHFETQENPLKRAFMRGQWRKCASFEAAACRRFDRVVAVSPDDRDYMRREYRLTDVADIPTGVDTAYFRNTGQTSERRFNLVFTGSMDWLPNEDAIRYFAAEILPSVRGEIPGVSLTVVGRSPSPTVLALASNDKSIEVTGRVDDVRPYIERAAAFVVPLRIGGGTRLKLYEAMAMQKAVVSTGIGAEGLPLTPGREFLRADSAEEFAKAVVRVLQDDALRQAIARRAAETVRRRFGWAMVARQFTTICEDAVESRSTHSANA